MGANDYITKIRMERAIWLILHTELSVNDIADKTGFSTARYFSTVFKQHTVAPLLNTGRNRLSALNNPIKPCFHSILC